MKTQGFWKEWFGFPSGYHSLSDVAIASQVRLSLSERSLTCDAVARLGEWWSGAPHGVRDWHVWYSPSPFHCLAESCSSFIRLGGSLSSLCRSSQQDSSQGPNGIQRQVHVFLVKLRAGGVEPAVRRRLDRWLPILRIDHMGGNLNLPRWTRAVIEHIRWAGSKTTPAVAAAILSTLHDRWCTSVRFGLRPRGCVFRCDSSAGADSLQHYARCPHLTEIGHTLCCIPRSTTLNLSVMLGIDVPLDPTDRARCAVYTYVAYSLFNMVRNSPLPSSFSFSSLHALARRHVQLGPLSKVRGFLAGNPAVKRARLR